MDDNTTAVAVLSTFFLFAFPLITWIVFRWLAHRERMEMIRHGMAPDPRLLRRPVPPSARAGETYVPVDGQQALHKGIRLTAIGLAVTIGLSFIGYRHGEIHPGPWLLGGLLPLFIGLSQVVTAMLSGAAVRPAGSWQSQAGPYRADANGAQANGAASGATFDGPYSYRPGGTQELRPPTPPPERHV